MALNLSIGEKRGRERELTYQMGELLRHIDQTRHFSHEHQARFSQAEFTRILIEDLEISLRSIENSLVEFHS